MRIRKNQLIALSLFVFIISAPFGSKIVGRFAISNVGQIISFLMILPVIATNIDKAYIKKNLIIILLMLVAASISSIKYDISMHLGHVSYFTLITLYISFLFKEVKNSQISAKAVRKCYLLSIYCFFFPFLIMCYQRIILKGGGYDSYMFDDKSHTVIFFSFYAFQSLVLLKGKIRYIISVLYFLLALTTTSRLGVIFIPFYILALYATSASASNIVKKILSILFVVVFITLGIYFVFQNKRYFSVFGRIGQSSGSTRAHLVLIFYSLKIKRADIVNFLIGTGPGSFSNILVASGMDLSAIKFDIGSYRAILRGDLPVHSTHAEIFMDFSIYTFALYVKNLWTIFKGLYNRKQIVPMLFYISFLGAEVFYTTFHENAFFVILLFCYLLANADIVENDQQKIL